MKPGHAPIKSTPQTDAREQLGLARIAETGWSIDRCAEPNPFYASELLGPALAHLDPDGAVHLVEAHDTHGDVIARLPVTAARRHGRFPIRHAVNWMHRHCFYGAPLLGEGEEDAGWRGLLGALDALPWTGAFLHLRGLDPHGPAIMALRRVCEAQGRRCEEIERYERALLRSDRDAESYWTANVRAKKRKELRRLQHRLAECGEIRRHVLSDAVDLPVWIDAFLALEAKGWKGAQGTALGSHTEDAAFLRAVCHGAYEAGMLDMLRIDCDGQPIAILINFVTAQGGFSFKIAIDPEFARYSPGVLIEQDNLARVLDEAVAPWMDSCAAPDHPMIDSLWGERRAIAQYRVALRKPGLVGRLGRMALPAMTFLETSHARIKSGVRT